MVPILFEDLSACCPFCGNKDIAPERILILFGGKPRNIREIIQFLKDMRRRCLNYNLERPERSVQ